MAQKPLQLLSEFAAEAKLTGAKYLIVEGSSDVGFFKQWVTGADFDVRTRPLILAVNEFDMDAGQLFTLGLNDAERSRVICLALFAESEKLDSVRCIADRDAEHGVKSFTPATLIWTDFPALESYGFEASTIDTLNTLFLGGRLPDGTTVIDQASTILLELYTVRTHHEHLPTPDVAKGLSWYKKQPVFRVESAVAPQLASEIATYPRGTFSDQRSHAYGHDVCAVIICLYANVVKSQAGVRSQEALEDMLRAAILVRSDFAKFPLFQQILAWTA